MPSMPTAVSKTPPPTKKEVVFLGSSWLRELRLSVPSARREGATLQPNIHIF